MWFDLDWMAFHEAEAQNQEALLPDLLRKFLGHTTCILTQTHQTVLGSSTEPCSREAYKAVFPVLWPRYLHIYEVSWILMTESQPDQQHHQLCYYYSYYVPATAPGPAWAVSNENSNDRTNFFFYKKIEILIRCHFTCGVTHPVSQKH